MTRLLLVDWLYCTTKLKLEAVSENLKMLEIGFSAPFSIIRRGSERDRGPAKAIRGPQHATK